MNIIGRNEKTAVGKGDDQKFSSLEIEHLSTKGLNISTKGKELAMPRQIFFFRAEVAKEYY